MRGVEATFAMRNPLFIHMPRIARAIRAHMRSITERRLRKRLLSFLGIAIIALCHRVAHDNDFARIAGRARLSRLRVANANLGTRSRRTRWQRRVARGFRLPRSRNTSRPRSIPLGHTCSPQWHAKNARGARRPSHGATPRRRKETASRLEACFRKTKDRPGTNQRTRGSKPIPTRQISPNRRTTSACQP